MCKDILIRFEDVHLTENKKQTLGFKKSLSKIKKMIIKEHDTINGLSFEIKRGEHVGIMTERLEKESLNKLFTNVIDQDSGEIINNAKRPIRFSPDFKFQAILSIIDNIKYAGAFFGFSIYEIEALTSEVLEFGGLKMFKNTLLTNLDQDTARMFRHAFALVFTGDLLILNGAYKAGSKEFQAKCKRRIDAIMANKGKTIIVMNNNLTYLNELCDRVIVLSDGKVIREDTPENLIMEKKEKTRKEKEKNMEKERSINE